MTNSSPELNRETIKKLICSFADYEPLFASLGTPFLVDTQATEALVQMGITAVPALLKALDAENSKIVMYAAYCLGQIGDRSVLQKLQQTKEKFRVKEPKNEYDFAVIGAINQAEEKF